MSNDRKVEEYRAGSKFLYSAGGLGLILAILVLINVIFSQVSLRWDATEDKLYSLSQGSKKILTELTEDVTIKVFFSKDNANIPVHIKTYTKRLLDFLAEYEYYSKGMVKIEEYDPKPDSEEEDWAIKYGIEGIDMPTGEKLYFGLVALAADQEEAIKSLDLSREEHLEYDITRIISRLQAPEKPTIGIISTLPIFGTPPMLQMQMQGKKMPPWLFVSELKKTYDVEEIASSAKKLDKSYDLLFLLHPKDISEDLQYAVDQFVLAGGNLIVYADPLAVSDASQGQRQGQASTSNPKALFSAWGINMEGEKIVMDFDLATRLRTRNNQVEDNPLWLSIPSASFNPDNIITANLDSMLLPIAGRIMKDEESEYEYEALITSSKNSSMTESFRIRMGSAFLRRDFKPSGKNYDMAVKISGKFKTAFPDGKPKGPDTEDGAEDASENEGKENASKSDAGSHLAEGKAKSTIIVVADSDMLFDAYYVNQQNFLGFNLSRIFNDNLNFLLNSCELLTGSEDLISIRSRGKFERSFTRIQEMEKAAAAKLMVREQELVRKVEETNKKLRELDQQKDSSQKYILSEEQEKEIKKFQEDKQKISRELKDVRRKKTADIERLGDRIKLINLFMMPGLVILAGLGYWAYRRKKA